MPTLFGEFLQSKGLVDKGELARALGHQAEHGGMLGQIAVELGLVEERDIAAALAEYLKLPLADLRTEVATTDALELVTEDFARSYGILPLRLENGSLFVAMADPRDVGTIEKLERTTKRAIRPLIAPRGDIERTIGTVYTSVAEVREQASVLSDLMRSTKVEVDRSPALETVIASAPAVQIVNLLLEQGLHDRASDIHLEPQERDLRVRYRVDGALHDVARLPSDVTAPLVSRIKIMSNMNIVERHAPQDGRLEVTIDGQPVDVRVSTTETIWGEKVVMRLLPQHRELMTLEQLGMPAELQKSYRRLTRAPSGMIVVAGPTGSGKTTTLYATLAEMDRVQRNIMTIEDPVEYVFGDINQIQIRAQSGVTFAAGLKSILRQDPDVILVGEIRDVETARIGVQSALTGHFVLSSLHATDCMGALMRFLDMGIEPFLVSAALTGVVSQRLLRRVCSHCAKPAKLTAEETEFYRETAGRAPKKGLAAGEGCNFCAGSGFLGRVGVYEMLPLSDEIRRVVLRGGSHEEIKNAALGEGLVTMLPRAIQAVDKGITTVGEVMRTLYEAT